MEKEWNVYVTFVVEGLFVWEDDANRVVAGIVKSRKRESPVESDWRVVEDSHVPRV